jgi:ribonuclease HII
MNTILGIDEAGRGSVIGPLVVAGVKLKQERLAQLEALGVNDSKQLTRDQREALAPQIEALAEQTHLVVFEAQELSENLTQVELRAMAKIINTLWAERVTLDLPVGPRAERNFRQSLQKKLTCDVSELITENKADSKFLIVGAASILAKVKRDALVRELHKEYGDFGWGYPGELKTREFLQDWHERHGRLPSCARMKWKTVQRMLQMQRALEL